MELEASGRETETSEGLIDALRDLNTIRNALAHNLEPKNIENQFCQLFKRFEEFEEVRSLLDDKSD